MLRKAGKDLLRLVQGLPVFGAAVRQVLQQPPGSYDKVGLLQGRKPFGGQGAGQPGPHSN